MQLSPGLLPIRNSPNKIDNYHHNDCIIVMPFVPNCTFHILRNTNLKFLRTKLEAIVKMVEIFCSSMHYYI